MESVALQRQVTAMAMNPSGEFPTNTDVDATRTTAVASSVAGSIGPYRLLQKLGEGGMGEVWLAEQSQPVHRQVALKVVKTGMDTAQVVARFEAERQALAMMDHPSIAKVFDGGASSAGRPYFAMEYVRGEAITVYCDRHRLSMRERLDLFIALCEGVQHAHQKGVIHRDLKPSNVLVALQGDRPVPRIIDFGVAKAIAQPLTDRSLFTQLGVLIGTPEYMSPEQAEMTSLDVDTRSDVYSLGLLLYELLVGTLPYEREAFRTAGLDEMRRTIRERSAPRPSTRITQLGDAALRIAEDRRSEPRVLSRQLKGDLDWIVLKALEKDRTRRYQTANDLALDVRRHLNDEPVSAGPPSAVYRVNKFVRRHRMGVSVAAVVTLVIMAFVASVVIQSRRVAREAERANRAEADARREASTAKAVLDFLQNDLLAQAGATTQAGAGARPDPDLTVRTALERAAQGVTKKFGQQPIVEASIRQTIGTTYQDLGLYPEAQVQLERALELRRNALGETHADTLATTDSLGDLYRVSGRYQQAEPLLATLVETRRRVLGDDHVETLSAMNNLGLVYRYQGKYAQAEALFTKVVDADRRLLGERNQGTLTEMNNLGSLYSIEGKYDLATQLLQRAKEVSMEVLGDEHTVTVTIASNLANAYSGQGRFDKAEPLYVMAAEFTRRVLGEKHPNTLTAAANLAAVYVNEGKYGEADPLFRTALATGRVVQGDAHPNTLLTMRKMADSYIRQGRYREASTLVSEARERLTGALGKEHPDTLSADFLQAEIFERQHMSSQAEALFAAVLDVQRRRLSAESPDALRTMAALGWSRVEQQHYAEAVAPLRDAVAGYQKVAPNSWRRYRAEALLAASLAGQKKYADAEPLLTSAYDGLTRLRSTIPASDQREIAEVAKSGTQLYRAWGKPAQAAEWQTKVERPL